MRKLFTRIMVVGLMMGVLACPLLAEGWPMGLPSARHEGNNVVPLPLLQRIAASEARRTWGDVFPIAEIPCCDEQGKAVAYMFVFQRGGVAPKTPDEVMSQIREGRERYAAAGSAFARAQRDIQRVVDQRGQSPASQPAQQPVGDKAQQDTSTMVPSNLSPPTWYRDAYDAAESASKQMWGVGQFGTLLVSARYDLIPIPVRMHGLPYYFVKGDVLQQEASKSVGAPARLTRLYMAGPLDQVWEYSGENGKKVLLDPFSARAIPDNRLPDAFSQTPSMKHRPEVTAPKWQKLKAQMEGEKP